MVRTILWFHLKYRAKKLTTYIYFGTFALIGYMAMLFVGDAFKNISYDLGVGAGSGNVNANAPFALYYLITLVSSMGVLVTAAFFGSAGHRDFKENTHALFFSYPTGKGSYIAGRFLAALISTMFVFSGVGLGALLGSGSELLEPGKMGSINIFAYIQPYLLGVLPNVLVAGVLFFSMALLARRIFPVYVAGIGMFTAYMVGVSLTRSVGSGFWPSLLDPFGKLAAQSCYQYWTAAQKNILLIPSTGNLLINRLFWLSVAVLVLIEVYRRFEFSQIFTGKKQSIPSAGKDSRKSPVLITQPLVNAARTFGFKQHLKQAWATALLELKVLVKNIYFLSILIMGVFFMFFKGFSNIGTINGTQTYPVTYQVLEITGGTFTLFLMIIILFSAGELVWRERDKKVEQMYDVLPLPEWVPFMGKLGALLLVQVGAMLAIMLGGILIQALHGYYRFEFGLYLKELFGMRIFFFLFYSVLAMVIQVLANNKYMGHFLMFLFLLLDDILPELGFEHHLYRFATPPGYRYSDMNGYGPYAEAVGWINLYWSAFAVLLVILAVLFWMRGGESGFKKRLRAVNARLTRTKRITAAAALLVFLITGGYVFYNTTILNRYETAGKTERIKVDYERRFRSYSQDPQPQLMGLKLNIDIFPYQCWVRSSGRMVLENKTSNDIDEVFVHTPQEGTVKKLVLSVPYTVIEESARHRVFIYQLKSPMRPGQTVFLDYEIEIARKGFRNNDLPGMVRSPYTALLHNGTFLETYHLVPALGYNHSFFLELNDNDRRQRYGLEPREPVPLPTDPGARMYTMMGKDSHWIDFEAVVGTAADQTALTSGDLTETWLEGGRRYFRYKAPGKIQKYIPLVSAKYTVKRDQWRDIGIEVYYHNDHHYNVDMMISTVKESLEYFTRHFGPYQFNTIRIAEYPRYQEVAESYPGVIPISEGVGFIAKFNSKKIPYVLKTISHEVAHQWWGHQVLGAYVQGEFLMSETLAQYSSLMVLKKKYNRETIGDYMKERLNQYLKGRARETHGEVPLELTHYRTPYVHYEKGMLVMNALQAHIGEENLNGMLKKYLDKTAFQYPPYTTSTEFLEYLEKAVPGQFDYLVEDMFKTITLFDAKAIKAHYVPLAEGRFRVTFTYNVKKLRADEEGSEHEVALNDWITFAVLNDDGQVLCSRKHLVKVPKGELVFVVDSPPKAAAIDPYWHLTDKNPGDNVVDAAFLKGTIL